MENNKLFKSFEYVVRNLFVYDDKVEVKVFFIYKEIYSIPLSLFIKKVKNHYEDYYLDEAKKIIEKMINDGSLKKECEKKVKRKKLLPILIPIVSAMAIAGITVGCYYGLQIKAQEVEVVFLPTSNNHKGHWKDNNGTEARTIKVQSGKTIDKNEIPEVAADAIGAEFSGWYKEGTDVLFNLSNTVITANTSLVAHYSGGAINPEEFADHDDMTTDKFTIVSNESLDGIKKLAFNERFKTDSDVEIKVAFAQDGGFINKVKEYLDEGNVDAIYVTESALMYELLESDIKFKHFDNALSDLLSNDDYYKYFFKIGQIEKADSVRTYAFPTFVSPNVFLYRRSTFKQYFYTDDPTDVQSMISTFDNFSTISGEIKEKSQYASILQDDIYEMYKGTRTQPWLIPLEDGNLECTVSDFVSNYLDYARTRYGNGWDKFSRSPDLTKWSDEWFANFKDSYSPGQLEGKYLGFLTPAWEIKYTVAMNCGETFGDWAICPGPLDVANIENAHGSFVLVPQSCKNPKSVCDFIRNLTSDNDTAYNYCLNNAGEYVAGEIPEKIPYNKKLLNKLIGDSADSCTFLGGQEYYSAFKQVLDAVENTTSNEDRFYPSIYEKDIDDAIKNNAYPYFEGETDKDTTIENIKNQVQNLDSRIVFSS